MHTWPAWTLRARGTPARSRSGALVAQFRHLRYFAKIVEAGSFSRAAVLIHIAQPALSKPIAELEDEFGVTLLQRSARCVRSTVAGEELYQEARKLIRRVDDLPSIVRSSQGDVRVVVPFGMASTVAPALTGKMLEICRNTLPQVTLRFVTGDSLAPREKVTARVAGRYGLTRQLSVSTASQSAFTTELP